MARNHYLRDCNPITARKLYLILIALVDFNYIAYRT